MRQKLIFLVVAGVTEPGEDPGLTTAARRKTRGLRVYLQSPLPPMFGVLGRRHREMSEQLGNQHVLTCKGIFGQIEPMKESARLSRPEIETELCALPHGAVVCTDGPVLTALGSHWSDPGLVYKAMVGEDGHVIDIHPVVDIPRR